jgi:ABC-type antimicrobial peptide transport system permease subunit
LIRAAEGWTVDAVRLRTELRRDYGSMSSVALVELSRKLEPWLQNPKLYAILFGAFAIVGLILAAVGLFAVATFDVSQRRHEMGVRLTLGATSSQITQLLIREAIRPVAIGFLVGCLGAWWAAKVFQSLLHQTNAHDLSIYAFVGVVLLGTVIAAAWRPARQAGKEDPLTVLRAQ